ncbi:hypothetical protein PoB_004831900 [Plakobranchus ocellatus]|uniref:Uncharacterized protein n=1 Tax=Plakobranchus ocellatus TaxID=259542 RepID=A0AAV4BNX4_9GAST|nr:hypothetical protein PoB_004831900 [Plakobranchus ocellatus]
MVSETLRPWPGTSRRSLVSATFTTIGTLDKRSESGGARRHVCNVMVKTRSALFPDMISPKFAIGGFTRLIHMLEELFQTAFLASHAMCRLAKSARSFFKI